MKRKAISFVELMVVMTITSVTLTTGLGLVRRAMLAEKRIAGDVCLGQVVDRLATMVRQDVHDAATASLKRDDSGVTVLELRQPARVVRYRIQGQTVTRDDEQPGLPTHRDAFVLVRYGVLNEMFVQFDVDEARRRVTMQVDRRLGLPHGLRRPSLVGTGGSAPADDAGGVPLPADLGGGPSVVRAISRVEATIGRNRRFFGGEGE
jgi:hypothetical protein